MGWKRFVVGAMAMCDCCRGRGAWDECFVIAIGKIAAFSVRWSGNGQTVLIAQTSLSIPRPLIMLVEDILIDT